MVQEPSTPGGGQERLQDNLPTLPPEEGLWQRYSPHHELPLSSMSSLAVHLCLLGLIVLGSVLVAGVVSSNGSGPAVGALAIEDEKADLGEPAPPDREVIAPVADPHERPANPEKVPLEQPQAKPLDLSPPAAGPDRPLNSNELRPFDKVDEKLRKTLESRPPGDEKGNGPGDGRDGPGSKPRKIERIQRQLRWTMTFTTRDGNDYLRQLHALGAILAYPGSEGKYFVIRDLTKRPIEAKDEPQGAINRISWIDNRPESVKSLASALGIAPPAHFAAFFPEKLEKEMLRKELAFAGRKEEAIHETRFTVVPTASGYEPRVVSQTPVK